MQKQWIFMHFYNFEHVSFFFSSNMCDIILFCNFFVGWSTVTETKKKETSSQSLKFFLKSYYFFLETFYVYLYKRFVLWLGSVWPELLFICAVCLESGDISRFHQFISFLGSQHRRCSAKLLLMIFADDLYRQRTKWWSQSPLKPLLVLLSTTASHELRFYLSY